MGEECTLTIHNSSDAIIARAEVRKLAQRQGLDLAGQARISLATYSLANALGMRTRYPVQVIIDLLAKRGRAGVSVACVTPENVEAGPTPETFSDVRWMVDELIVETLPSSAVKVTLIQWTMPGVNEVFKERERPFRII
jgi:hypothetical protein